MDSEVPVFTNDNYGNSFSKIAIAVAVVWVGSIVLKNAINPSPSKQYHQEKRFTIKSGRKINKEIMKKNHSIPIAPKIDLFSRNKRFNRYF